MDRLTKIDLLMQVIQGAADRSILKTNKLLFRRGVGNEQMFEINGKQATLTDVFTLFYTDPTFTTEIIAS